METLITVVVPIYNVASYLERCIYSIIEAMNTAHIPKAEVILVDDGSTDDSGRIADKIAAGCSCMQVLHQGNMGVAAARNLGMTHASGEWIYFMDGDDWLAEGAFEAICLAVNENPAADVVLFDAYKNYDGREIKWEHFSEAYVWELEEELRRLQRAMLYYPKEFPKTKVPLAAPWDKVYRRAFLKEHNICFPEQLSVLDDMIFNMEAAGKARKIAYVKLPIYHYRYVADSITNCYKQDRIRQDAKVWQYIETYMDTPERMPAGTGKEKEEFVQSYYCRIIKSFAISLRLNLYHKKNEKSWFEKQRNVKSLLQKEPYRKAFREVRTEYLEWKLKMLVLAVRGRRYWMIYLFYLAQDHIMRF